MCQHGQARNIIEKEYIVVNNHFDTSSKVIELSRLEKYVVKEVYCAKCENWQETDSRYFITDICCPTCCINWS